MPQQDQPARMSICDLQSPTDNVIEVMFNPTELTRRVGANYAKRNVLGASHQPHEYLQTTNQEIMFDLFYLVERPVDALQADDAARFLESLLYAPESPESITQNSPPRVLLLWPNSMSITCRLMDIEFKSQRWNLLGDLIQWTASTTWEEARITRLTKQDVRRYGSFRPPQGAVSEGGGIEVGGTGGILGALERGGVDITDQAAVDLALAQGLITI